jgi:hypothetical protein
VSAELAAALIIGIAVVVAYVAMWMIGRVRRE